MSKVGAKKKSLTLQEQKFAMLLSENYSATEAARKAFGWKCDRFTAEELKARSLAQSARVKDYVSKLVEKKLEQEVLESAVDETTPTDWNNIHFYAYKHLKEIRDNPSKPSRMRWEAVQAIEQLSDPAQDINLIWKYIEAVWAGFTAHCPCCHEDFPLAAIKNPQLEKQLKFEEKPPIPMLLEPIDRRLDLLDKADKRRSPRSHPSQMRAISALERHVVALGKARAGKSTCLGQFGLLNILMPGANIWILGRTYDDAKYEFEYIQSFLFTMFYPVEKHMYTVHFDKKTGDASIQTRWGAELTVKSGKAKGSITGQELDCMLVAEPGWVDADLFEEVRARMSSRLGRIFALGTPKGFGNFLGRMVKLSQRDMRTGKKLEPGSRLIANGSKWAQSLLVYDFDAKDNPEYVLSELETARLELTEAEYASEFEGKMVVDQDKKFPFIKPHHLQQITPEDVDYCSVVVGVDQGPRNFAAIIVGWDGKKLYCIDEYFDGTGENTMKANLIKVNNAVPQKLMKLRIPQEKWALTIFDADPPLGTQLEEMKVEGKEWKTDFTFRPKNEKDFMNWREETIQFINQLGMTNAIVFCPATEILHEQIMEVIALPDDPRNENSSKTRKGWLVNDMWRGDHILDSLLLATWTIYQNMVLPQKRRPDSGTIWQQIEKNQEFEMQKREAEELKGFTKVKQEEEIFSDIFGFDKPKLSTFNSGRNRSHYPDA